jgi:hypothetical protein
VVKYAFLADFDLLWDSQQDVHDHPWTKPACHVVIDQHFKLECAHEEIQCLNVEVHCVVTYIQDKDAFFCLREAEVRQVNPGLVHQVKIHQRERGCFNKQHMCCFRKLASLPGFTSSIKPGISVGSGGGVDNTMDVDVLPNDDQQQGGDNIDNGGDGADSGGEGDNGGGEGDKDEEDDQEDEDIQAMITTLMSLAVDTPGVE